MSIWPDSGPASTCWGYASTPRRMPASRESSRQPFSCRSPVSHPESATPRDSTPIDEPPRLFGTDGVRGTAGQYPLDRATVRRLGAALIRALPDGGSRRILIGRDTRESGEWIESELAHGASGEGASVTSAGVVPTPAIAYLTRSSDYVAGVVISASHNPFQDNGIKVFSGSGEKFTERVERQVEEIMADQSW